MLKLHNYTVWELESGTVLPANFSSEPLILNDLISASLSFGALIQGLWVIWDIILPIYTLSFQLIFITKSDPQPSHLLHTTKTALEQILAFHSLLFQSNG